VHSGGRSVVTIGAYDGVHIGHRRVVDKVLSLAAESGLESVILTFDRHPAALVRPESAPKLLTDLPQKLELLEETGVDHVVVLRFDEERASETAEDFVDDVLVGELSTAIVVVGRDFHFGKGRGGNVGLLEAMGADRDMKVVPFDLVSDGAGSEVVSSTRIRSLVGDGEMEAAAGLLGRPHEVRGVVSDGGASAYRLEVPAEILLPPPGLYGCLVGIGHTFPEPAEVTVLADGELAVTSGVAPTPGESVRVLFQAGPQT
jgi:riboflavin kinase/FMN adenylyltransferase